MLSMNKVVFCTAYIASDPQRYQNWIDYYTEFFAGCGIDLWMINDGPCNDHLDLKGVNFHAFDRKLGRDTCWIFPGWKRSFFYALKTLTPIYSRIAHVESDCWLTKKGRQEFLYYFEQDGYFTGFAKAYNFPEASLQIINDPIVRQYVIDKYSCEENWYENIDFEQDLARLKPVFILDGDRIEMKMERFDARFTFVSGMPCQEFKRLYAESR
jgi:hypothetical protein